MFDKIKNILTVEDTKWRFFWSVILSGLGVFLFISFISFFMTWENDQSELLNKSGFEILFSSNDLDDPTYTDEVPLEIQNSAGKLGAIVAKKWIHDWFGIGSFTLIFLCFYFAARLLFAIVRKTSVKRYLFIAISLMIMSSIVLGFFANNALDGNLGGCFGYYLCYGIIRNNLGTFLTGFAIICATAIYITFTFPKTLPFCLQKCKALFSKRVKQEPETIIEDTTNTIQEETVQTNTTEIVDPLVATTGNEVVEQPEPQETTEEPIKEVDLQEQEQETSQNTTETAETEEQTTDIDITEPEDNSEERVEDDSVKTKEEEQQQEKEENITEENKKEEEKTLDPNDEEDENEKQPVISIQPIQPTPSQKPINITNTNQGVEDTGDIPMIMTPYDPKADLSHFKQPDLSLLHIYDNDKQAVEIDDDEIIANQNLIEKTLSDFKIEIEKIHATVGPTITLFEIVPKAGTKISRIQSLEKDIMMSLSALSVRIIAPIPGKGTVGIEVPNKIRQVVSMYSVLNSKAFKESKMELPVALGKTITNEVYMFDLAKTPHLLVAGATGQGKSVGLNAIVTSLLYKKHPSQLKFVMVDPKMVEFSIYEDLKKHYLAQYPGEDAIIITDCLKVQQTLKSLVQEMEDRYRLLTQARCRNIIEYNDKFIHRLLNPNNGHKYMCYIVIIIDEFGDFIMQAGKEIETPIARIAQKARAVGMHLILATQRPSVNIITGIIKANVPSRMAFKTASRIDSQTILDSPGAEGLVGKGDLLISTNGAKAERVQCAFVDTPEVERIVKFISNQQGYSCPYELPEIKDDNNGVVGGGKSQNEVGELDSCFEDAAKLVVIMKQGSASTLQRKFNIGFNRAGRIIDQLEAYKIVGEPKGSKPRDVLVPDEIALEQILDDLHAKGILK